MRRVTEPETFGRVAVVMGGDSAEREVSLVGGRAVLAALEAEGIDAFAVDGAGELLAAIRESRVDRVFIMLHGRGGEDGTLQGALDVLGVPYTGSDVLGCALTLDKVRCKEIWQARGLPCPDGVEVAAGETAQSVRDRVADFGLPLIVKPVREGSTIGMSRVDDYAGLTGALALARRYDADVLIERFVDGPEYTAAILDGECLPLIRIEAETDVYDYHAKYESEATHYFIPAGFDEATEREHRALCLDAFRATACSGWGRVDFMCDAGGRPRLLEVNTVPGMTSHSLVPMAAKATGVDFNALCRRILATSLEGRP